MYQFFDPSIKPILTTDLDGIFMKVRTYGLSNYGYPDIILNEFIENYEELFFSIIDRIFRVDFDISGTWSHDGKIFRLELVEENLAALVTARTDDYVKIITINNPLNEKPMKYITKGLETIYDHPEFEVLATINNSREILAFVVEEIENDRILSEEYSIEYESYKYTFRLVNDRYGKTMYQINQEDYNLRLPIKVNNKNRSHLQRVK